MIIIHQIKYSKMNSKNVLQNGKFTVLCGQPLQLTLKWPQYPLHKHCSNSQNKLFRFYS